MHKSLLTILQILFTVSLGFAQEKQGEFMRLHSERIKVNDSLCYQVRKEYSGIDTTAWEPFCGVLDNFYFRSWYEYTLQVEEYNPHADTICVIKTIAQYPKGQFMKIHRERIMVNDSLCYQVRKGFSRRDKTPWEPFCGKFSNLWCEEGYEYTLHVKEYNPHADTIHVIMTIARDEVQEKIKRNIQARKRMGMQTNNNDSVQTTPTSNGE